MPLDLSAISPATFAKCGNVLAITLSVYIVLRAKSAAFGIPAAALMLWFIGWAEIRIRFAVYGDLEDAPWARLEEAAWIITGIIPALAIPLLALGARLAYRNLSGRTPPTSSPTV